jgi:hypothetical protein
MPSLFPFCGQMQARELDSAEICVVPCRHAPGSQLRTKIADHGTGDPGGRASDGTSVASLVSESNRRTETLRTVLGRIILVIAALHLLCGRLLAQGPSAPIHLSPLLGQSVSHPESLSGIWEAPELGQGGAVGIHLQLTTTVPADVTTLSGVTQSWFSLTIGVYQRKGATIQFGEENFFVDSYPDSGIRFDQGRLTLHFASPRAGVGAVDLDLVQQPDSAWEGRFHRGAFDSTLKLLRPGVGAQWTIDPVIGTWLENTGKCLHVAQQTATEWTGWADFLTVPGNVQYPPHLKRPATAQERYGELVRVERQQDHSFSFELGANAAGCCSHTFMGTPNADGTLLEGTWPPGPNQAPHPGSWRKMRGDSCVDPGH